MELKYKVFDDSIMYVETGRVRISWWNEMAFSWDCTISFFLNFGLMQETHMTLCCYRATFSRKIFLSPKLEKRIKSGPKQDFLNLLKNLVMSCYWICLIMKNYTISCVPAQISCLGNFFSWDMAQNNLSQSNFRIF